MGLHGWADKASIQAWHHDWVEQTGSHLGIAVPHMCHIVDTVQIVHTISIIEMAALSADHVQGLFVIEGCIRPDMCFPLGNHICVWHVVLLQKEQLPVSYQGDACRCIVGKCLFFAQIAL